MSLSDRLHTINQELKDLKQPPVIGTPDAIRAIANRREAVKHIEGSGCTTGIAPCVCRRRWTDGVMHVLVSASKELNTPCGAEVDPGGRSPDLLLGKVDMHTCTVTATRVIGPQSVCVPTGCIRRS
jgi:hypothetical protein